MTKPLVSIGLPVYNGDAYLEDALHAILQQTYEHFELIISDNASTDRTEAICRLYAASDARIRYIRHETNRGGAANFNGLVALARGKYFRWACHDDTIEPTCIERCVEVLEADASTVLCYPRTQMIGSEDEPLDNDRFYLKSLHLQDPRPHRRFQRYMQTYYPVGGRCNPVYGVIRRRILAETALISSYPDSDVVLLGEIALWGKYYEIPERLFNRREHPETSMRAHPGTKERAVWFDPSNEGKIIVPYWQRLVEYVRALRRAPLSTRERLYCYWVVLRYFVRHKHAALHREAKEGSAALLRRWVARAMARNTKTVERMRQEVS